MDTSDAPKCQSVTPDVADNRRKSEQVRDMFDHIAPRYDLMNRLMTAGIDKLWRRRLVRVVRKMRPLTILDIATGTGDLAIKLAEKVGAESIVGVDLSENMIARGRKKVLEADLADIVTFQPADSMNLPFADETFDAVTVAYGVRNFEDLLRGYQEMWRVLKPGGLLCVLELSTPQGRITKKLYDFYSGKIIPRLGKWITGDSSAYRYLPRSIAAVPQGEQMLSIIEAAGFFRTAFRTLTFGACTLYMARKDRG